MFTEVPFVLVSIVLASWPSAAAEGQVYRECRREGMIALTFDQGPSLYTGILLTALAQAGVKATFHVTPDYLDNPVLSANLRRAALEGHLIGLFVKESVTETDVKAYLANATSIVRQYINYSPQYLRFPVPGPTAGMMETVSALGYRVSGYNLDSLDYQYASDPVEGGRGPIFRTVKATLELIVPPTLGSFIVVQRDIVQASVLQTAAILKFAEDRGYKMVKLDDCTRVGATIDSKGSSVGDDVGGGQLDGASARSEANVLLGSSYLIFFPILFILLFF